MTAAPLRPLLDHRLIVVTGKGGTGKTALSCLLAEAARQDGRRVLLVETAASESIAALFEPDPRPLSYEGRELRPELHAIHIDPHDALADYVRLQVGLPVITDRVLRTETFRQLLEAAPGWRELIILGKIWHLEQKTDPSGRPAYDLLIVDAPATGHGLTFLDVPRVIQLAVRAGPLARHASWVEALVHDRKRTLLLPVTLPEELPVLETKELVDRARKDIDIAVDRILVNQMPVHFAREVANDLARLPTDLDLECLPPVSAMRTMLDHSARRAALAIEERARVSALCGLPVIDVPAIPGGFDADGEWTKYADAILAPERWPDDPESTSDRAATS
jgi:anion-transporting  ArsA/GET3 family ATPase